MSTAAAKEETDNVDYNLGDAEKSLGARSFSAPHLPSDAISMILSTENQTPFDSERQFSLCQALAAAHFDLNREAIVKQGERRTGR